MKCPICGNDNGCFVDNKKDPNKCWCHTAEFPKNLPKYDSCICKSCVKKLLEEELKNEIIETEKQFMNDANTHGADGWVKYFLPEGQMVTGEHNENIVGLENIKNAMEPFFSKGYSLTWKPDVIEFSDDFSQCFSTGKYVRTVEGKEYFGKFLTVWKRTSDGWKIKVDIGN